MSQNTNSENITSAQQHCYNNVVMFNNNKGDNMFSQPVKNQLNLSNAEKIIYKPKIKIKDLKELQEAPIIDLTEKQICIPKPHFSIVNSQTYVDHSKTLYRSATDQNFEKVCSEKSNLSQNISGNTALKKYLKEFLLRDKLSKIKENQNLIREMRAKANLILKSSKTYSFSKSVNRPIIKLKGGQKSVLERKRKFVSRPQTRGGNAFWELQHGYNLENSTNCQPAHSMGVVDDGSTSGTQVCSEGTRNYFDFVSVEGGSCIQLKSGEPVESANQPSTSIKSLQNATVENCDCDSKQEVSQRPNLTQTNVPNIEISNKIEVDSTCFATVENCDYDSKQEVSQRPNLTQTNVPNIEISNKIEVDSTCFATVENCDYDSKQEVSQRPNLTQTNVPTIEISNKIEVDSTCLRDGIIKASRTLINTEKTLKVLSHIISRGKSLPPKHAINMLKRFQGIYKSFTKEFDEIERVVKNEYKDIFPISDIRSLVDNLETEKSLNNKKKIEISTYQGDNSGIPYTGTENLNLINSMQALNSAKNTNALGRSKIRPSPRAKKSDDSESDESFQPDVQIRNLVTTRREIPQRFCRKKQISFACEFLESDDEADP